MENSETCCESTEECCTTKSTVTEQCVKDFIRDVQVTKMGNKTCVVLATLRNGFEVLGHSACVDADNYNEEIGKEIAMRMVENKVWEYLGFTLQNDLVDQAQAGFNQACETAA